MDKKVRIIICDDDNEFYRACTEALGSGFITECVSRNGAELSAAVIAKKPDIVICDALMRSPGRWRSRPKELRIR